MAGIENFTQEKECTYRNERYSVRDNGTVLRHSHKGERKRFRKLDDQWTFGKLNKDSGYLEIASVRVHRILATAFHGEPPTKEHVVDHIDTNKQNNRPENLRWVTRLENILLNPITIKRIETACNCTIEEFLQNIDRYREQLSSVPQDISWMRRVSAEECKATLNNFLRWAESDSKPVGQSLGEWIYQKYEQIDEERVSAIFKKIKERTGISREEICSITRRRGVYFEARIYTAKTLLKELKLNYYQIGRIMNTSAGMIARYVEDLPDIFSAKKEESHVTTIDDRVAKSKFFLIPNEPSIQVYADSLKLGALFFENAYQKAYVKKSTILKNTDRLLVMYKTINKESPDNTRWGIIIITLVDGTFIHNVVTNYNDMLEHYWQSDTENHFNCIVNGGKWIPQYNSQKQKINGDYLESIIREYPNDL